MGKDKRKVDPEKEIRRKEVEETKSEKSLRQKEQGKPKHKIEEIVRILETDLDGNLPVSKGLRKIRGVSFMYSNAISLVCPFAEKRIGDLSENEIEELEDIIFNPTKYNIPSWLTNRRRDPETNKDMHLAISQLQLVKNSDINKMRKMKSYKGTRHSLGLPVRGQRTKSTGRKGKSVGVSKKKVESKK